MASSVTVSASTRVYWDGDSLSDPAYKYQCFGRRRIASLTQFGPDNLSPTLKASAIPPAWVNVGTSGATLGTIAGRAAANKAKYQPDLVIMHGGVNDVQTGVALATSQTNFTSICDTFSDKAFLFVLPFHWVALNATIVTFNAAMVAIAAGYSNMCVLNANTLMDGATNGATYTAGDVSEAHYNHVGLAAFDAMVRNVWVT